MQSTIKTPTVVKNENNWKKTVVKNPKGFPWKKNTKKKQEFCLYKKENWENQKFIVNKKLLIFRKSPPEIKQFFLEKG